MQKNVLIKEINGFEKDIDYIITNENPHISEKNIKNSGRKYERIMITADCFKMLAMLSKTEMGKKTRKYYVELEKLYFKNMTDKMQYINNPLPKIHSALVDITPYENNEVVYLIKVKDDIYKYGVTYDIKSRLKKHKMNFKYDAVIKIWLCKNRTVSNNVESKVKEFTKINKLTISYGNHTEVFQYKNIDEIIKLIDDYVNDEIETYEKKHNINDREKLMNSIINGKSEIKKEIGDENYCKVDSAIESLTDKLLVSDNKAIEMEIRIKQLEELNKSILKNMDDLKNAMEYMKRQVSRKVEQDEFSEVQTRVNNGESKVCKSCYTELELNEFSINPETGEYYLSCDPCKLEKSQNHSITNAEIIEKNKKLILEDKCICTKCKKEKSTDEYDINKFTKELNKQCKTCRIKDANYMANKQSLETEVLTSIPTTETIIVEQSPETLPIESIEPNETEEKLVCKNCYVLLPVGRYSINIKTGELYLSCDKCRNVKVEQRIKKKEKAVSSGKCMCNKCKRIFTAEQLGVNPKTNQTYKQCQPCRLKDSNSHKEKRAN
jgi:phage anti-repressor protein/predicted GIY-YIG superfamily endonuclease